MKRHIIIGVISIVVLISTWIGVGIVTATQNEEQEESITTQIDQSIEKYFNLEGNQVLLQQKIVVNANKNDAKKERERLSINVPIIQSQKPKMVNVLANGKLIPDSFCHYDVQNNQLNIESNENVSVYKIIYQYQGINAEQQEIELDTKVDTKYENIEEVETQDKKTMEITPMGEKVSVQGEITKGVYKGYLYEAKEDWETNYEENYMIEVSSIQNVEEINLSREKEVFTYEEGDGEEKTKIENSTKDHIRFNKMKIHKEQMMRILGEEGKITIKNAKEEILEELTKDSQVDEEGNIIIDFTDKEVKNIKVTTTKPVQLGEIKIYNQKEIDANIEYTKEEIKRFQNLENTIRVNESTNELKMNLINTISEATIHMDKTDLSTLQKNENVQIMLTILSKNQKHDLYKNPVVDLVFPAELQMEIKNVTQLNLEDVMKIEKFELIENEQKEKVLRISFKGEQTSYSHQLAEGIQVAIIGDISIANTTPSKKANIKVICKNENPQAEECTTQYPIKMNSKYGVLMINKIENYNQAQEVKETIDDKEILAQLDTLSAERMATQKIQIINNYESAISGVCFMGNLSEEPSIDMNFQPIAISENKRAKVYYAEKEQTEENSLEWKENLEKIEKARAYKIVIEDEIQAGEKVEISYSLQIPKNLETGKKKDMKNTLTYQYLGNIEKNVSNINFTTGNQQSAMFLSEKTLEDQQGIKAEVSAISGEQYLKDGDTVKEGQGIRYKIRVTNESKTDLKNVVLEATNTNAIYYDWIEYEEEVAGATMKKSKIEENEKLTSKELKIDSLAAGETKEVSYQISVKKVEDNNQKLTGQIKIGADNYEEVAFSNITNPIQKSEIKATLRYQFSENVITTTESGVPLALNVQNISNDVLKNVKVELPVTEGFEFTDAYVSTNDKAFKFVEYADGVAKFEISEIAKDQTVSANVQLLVKKMDIRKTEGVVSQYFKAIKEEEVYTSNDIQRIVHQVETKITVNQTTNREKQIIQDGDEIQFLFNIKNEGLVETEILITDQVPEGLKIKNAKMKTSKEEKNLTVDTNLLSERVVIQPNETIQLEIDTTVDKNLVLDGKITNYAKIDGKSIALESNKISFTIQLESEKDPSKNPEDPNNPGNKNDENGTYSISGIAWNDENGNGKKDRLEKKMGDMPVLLIDEDTGKLAKERTKTEADGSYRFENLKSGKYTVVFQYDANRYTVTTYQKEGIAESENSDVIYDKMDLENQELKVAKTKVLELASEDLKDIDAGFIEGKTFDLKIDKTIHKVTVANTQGAKVNSYGQEKLVKLEIDAKHLANSNVVIEYNIAVTNEGEVAGYANEVIDYVPQGLEFRSEMNTSWYQMKNGSIATKELSNQMIEPGETKNITLILTKKMTQSNTGTVVNKASIGKNSNDYGIEDKVSSNNESQAEVILSVRTGRIILYISFIIIIIGIIAISIYFIKEKVLVEGR